MRVELQILDDRLLDGSTMYATPGSAAFDLRACRLIDGNEILTIGEDVMNLQVEPGQTIKIGCGFAFYMCESVTEDPDSVPAAFILPRSGMGCSGLRPRNSPGLIDSDYQGEIIVCLHNESLVPRGIDPMMRIAQLMIVEARRPNFFRVSRFSTKTERGAGGFGHTGS